MGAYQGVNYRNYQVPRFAKVTGATAGFAFNHATEAFSGGLRKPGRLVKRTIPVMDAAGRPVADKIGCTLSLPMLQTRLADVLNFHKLILSGPHQWLFQTAKGIYLAFTDNDTGGGTFTTPVGSSLMGGNYEFVITGTERFLNYEGACEMANTEWDYMWTNSGSAAGGGSSGTTAGLTAHPYARGNYQRSGIASLSINGVAPGVFNNPRVSIKTESSEDGNDFRGRPVPAFGVAQCSFRMLQGAALDILGNSTAEQNDYTIQFGTWNDETIKFTTGAAGLYVSNQNVGDDSTMCEVTVQGKFPLIANDTSSMDIGVGSASVLECKLVAY